MKGGVIALTKAMALAYGPSGVRVNCICPGDVNTPMVAAYSDNAPDPVALRAEINSKCALRRIAEPEEVAEAIQDCRQKLLGRHSPLSRGGG